MINNSLLSNINIGGDCERLELVDNNSQLIKLIKEFNHNKKKYKVIGSGSNIFFDEHYLGAIIKNTYQKIIKTKYFPIHYSESFKNKDDIFIVSSGTILMDFVKYCQQLGYDISKLSGIPGTIGGAIYNNAGAYGLEISEILIGASMIQNGNMCYYSNKDFGFEYRNTKLKKDYSNDVIITAFFKLPKKENKNIIQENIDKILTIRKNKLPYSEKNIGSIFKNIYLDTVKIPTGLLLEKIGIKELTYKNLELYHKHSNVIINKGDSTPADLIHFINMIKDKFIEEYGIDLQIEIEKIY
jgi:UDP-N-acetylmuramate dehydrogenase